MPPGPLHLSNRVTALKAPATLAIMAKAKALTRQGVDIISFGLGEPDFDTPAPIRQAAADAMNAGQTHYMPTLGDPETRTVIAEKLIRENNIAGLTADHVAISAGAKHSYYLVCQCLLDPGADAPNEVLLPVPSWVSYAPMAELAGGRVKTLPTTAANNFKISPDQLRAAITPRSRMLVLNTPSNPCGTMYSEAELRALARVVAEAAKSTAPNLVIVTDEIYEKIVFGGIPHFSIGSIPEVDERTVTINGLSKAFAMTGWRIGYAAAPGDFGQRLIKGMDTMQGQMTSCITSFVYPAIRAALTKCSAETDRFCQAFAKRAKLIDQRARAIPGFAAPTPTGAFYLFPDVSSYFGRRSPAGKPIANSVDFAAMLLEEAHIAVVPGEEFGGIGTDHIRLSYACSEETINKGMDRIEKLLSQMR